MSGTSGPLKTVSVIRKGAFTGSWGAFFVTPKGLSPLNFCYAKLPQLYSLPKLKALAEIPYLGGHSCSASQEVCFLLSSHLLSNENIRPADHLTSLIRELILPCPEEKALESS